MAYLNVNKPSASISTGQTNLITLSNYKPLFTSYHRTSLSDVWGIVNSNGQISLYNSTSASKTNSVIFGLVYPIAPIY